MDHLQTCVEFAFAVLPKSSTFLQPCEGSFDDPSLGHDGKGVQLVSFCDLDACAKLFADRVGERSAGVAAVGQDAGDLVQIVGAAIEGGQSTLTVRYLRGRNGNRMR